MSARRSRVGPPPMPPATSDRARRAIARHAERFGTPPLEVTGDWDQWSFGNPFRNEDLANWQALILEAFGTRSLIAAQVFIRQLARLTEVDEETWKPRV